MNVVDGMKSEAVVAREDPQAGIPEVLAHREPPQLGGEVECSGLKCWFALLQALCELGMFLDLQRQFAIHQMELETLFMPWSDFMV